VAGGSFHVVSLACAGLLATAAIPLGAKRKEGSSASYSAQSAGLAAWERIATVLRHPRCLNCHQLESPLQGDVPRAHIPHVVRGPDDHGVSAMRCGNCHNQMGNNPTSRTPGAPHWGLAPVSMLWEGMSVGDLCRMIRDPERNGNRTPEALIQHMEEDPLVAWGWDPGPGLDPVPIPHQEFVGFVRRWVEGGTPCPQ